MTADLTQQPQVGKRLQGATPHAIERATEIIVTTGGTVSGGTAGAGIGAAIGCVAGPPGAAIGFLIGFTLGSVSGMVGGYKAAKWFNSKL